MGEEREGEKKNRFSFSEISENFDIKSRKKSKDDTKEYVTSDDVLGKIVLDPSGEVVGVAEKLFIDPKKIEVVGISIDKGFLRNGLFVGKDYIDRVSKHAVFLSVEPVFKLKGMLCFDSEGRFVGRVKGVELDGHKNRLYSLVLSRGIIFKNFEIPALAIEKIDENIILKGKRGDYV